MILAPSTLEHGDLKQKKRGLECENHLLLVLLLHFFYEFSTKSKKSNKAKGKKVKNPTKENVKDVLDDVDYHRTPTRNNI